MTKKKFETCKEALKVVCYSNNAVEIADNEDDVIEIV